jgi:GNAT superfamily N-acetyltransferase
VAAPTVVLTDDGRAVLGYFSLAAHTVLVPDAPEEVVAGVPRHLAVPSILLARLAVSTTHQGAGLGTRLVASVVHHAVRAQEVVAARLLVVDAMDDEAARFYARFRFTAWPADSPRLFARIRDLRATLAQGRPPPDVS